MRVSVMFARFPYGGVESHDVTDWLIGTIAKAKVDPRIWDVMSVKFDDTPITMTRNLALKVAAANKVDLVCMIDSDMQPDKYLNTPMVKPFWESSLDFVLQHEGPCVVGAPYCGPPPHENVYIFNWQNLSSEQPNPDWKLQQYTREHATLSGGIQEVGALPTGLILIDMRALNAIKPPYFDYEYADPPFNTVKSTTEDCYFTRNLSLAGVPQYVNWDAWAGHHKRKCVGRPILITVDDVKERFRSAIMANVSCKDRLLDVPEGGFSVGEVA